MHAYPRPEKTQSYIRGAVTGPAFPFTPGKGTGHCPSVVLLGHLPLDLPCAQVLGRVGRKPEISQKPLSLLLDGHL